MCKKKEVIEMKYVVYIILGYTDDYGYLYYDKHKVEEYEVEEDAIIRAHKIRHMGYKVVIEEE